MCAIVTVLPAASDTDVPCLLHSSCHALCSVMLVLHRCVLPSDRTTSPWSGQHTWGCLVCCVA